MKKFLKITGITLLVLIIALALAPFIFKGKILDLIRKEANENLNAKVGFSDNISIGIFSSFPNLNLGLEEVSVVGKDSFAGDTLAYLPQLKVTLDLMSVIKGDKIEIRSIYLKKPVINLLVLKSGRANWDISLPDTSKPAEPADTASKFKLGLEKLEIEQGNLVYDDKSMGFYTALKNFDHTLKGDFTTDKFLLETKTKAEAFTLAYGGIDYLHKVAADIKANLDMDMANMKFAFTDNDIILNQLQLGGAGYIDMNENDMDFDLTVNAKKTDFKNILSLVPGVFTKDFNQAKTSGKMAFDGFLKGKMTETAMPGFGLNLLIENGYFQYPALPKSLNDVNLKLNVLNKTGDMDNTVVDLSKFHSVIAGEPIDARLLVKTPISDMYMDGAVKGNVVLDEFRNMIPLDPATKLSGRISSDVSFKGYMSAIEKGQFENFNAAGNMAVTNLFYQDPVSLPEGVTVKTLSLLFNPKTVSMPVLEGNIGKSDFAANGELSNFFGYALRDDVLQGKLNFTSNYFNVNQFLSDEPVTETPKAEDTVKMQAFDVPGNIDFALNAKVNKLIYDNLVIDNLGGLITIKDKQIRFSDLALSTLGGTMALNGTYDSHNPSFPFSDIDFNIKNLDILQSFDYFDAVKNLLPIAKYTQGKFNASIRLANNFNQDMSLAYPTINGAMKIGIGDASVKDLKILNILSEKLKIDRFKNLALKNLDFKLQLDKGKVILDSLIVPVWQGAKAKISGYSALDKSINYVAKLSIPRKDFGAANTALNGLLDQAKGKGIDLNVTDMVDVDVLIGGFMENPDVKVSLHDAKKNLVDGLKNQLQAEADAAKAEALRRANEAKQKTIDSLNRIKQQNIDAAKNAAAAKQREAEEKAKAEADKAKAEAQKKLDEEKAKAEQQLKDKLKNQNPFKR